MTVETTTESPIGPAPDHDEILRVVNLYTEGFGSHKPARDVRGGIPHGGTDLFHES